MYEVFINKLVEKKGPVDIIVTGLGFMGFGFVSLSKILPGFRVPLVITRRPGDVRKFLAEKGFKTAFEENPSKIKDLADQGIISLTDNLDLIDSFDNDVVFEVTGNVAYGAEVALRTFSAYKHLVTMNPELQATIGTELKEIADSKGLVITDVIGDQPGSLARLIANAKMMGFKPLVAGNMKRYMDKYATQERMKPWAEDKGLAVRQTVSFTDGTKQSIEMNLVANYFGMKILKPGMKGPQINDIREALKEFENESIPSEGIVDYTIGMKLFPGVFIIAEHQDPHQQKYLRYLNMGEGPRYILFDAYHLTHLEAANTLASVILFRQETINNGRSPTTKTVAVAKRGLFEGQKLDGIGGDTVYGTIYSIGEAKEFLPVGMSDGAIIRQEIFQDQPIKIKDVVLPDNAATKLYNKKLISEIPPASDKELDNTVSA